MELFSLEKVPWQESQLIYHALGELNREALVLVSPASPYVCIGFHQDVDQEVDLETCQALNVPVFRREVGGGAVYLDGRQLFFQLIIRRDNPQAPPRVDSFYRKFLEPVIRVHHRLGIPAEFRPINDLVVHGRKISGTGAGEIGRCAVFVGNLILDFDHDTMAGILKVPDEKFRDKVKKTMGENMTTICRELGREGTLPYSEAELNAMMAEEFSRILGPFKPAEMDRPIREKMEELGEKMLGDRWLHRRGKRVQGRVVKVRAGLEVFHRVHKAPGGLIRADWALEDGRLREVNLSGDFFSFPKEAVSRLEEFLEGTDINELGAKINHFFSAEDIQLPGVALKDWLVVFSQ